MLCPPYVFDPTGRTVTCTSSTRPTGTAGLEIYEQDTDRHLLHDGVGWIILSEPIQDWTSPTFNNLTIGGGSWSGWHQRCDGWCECEGRLDFSGTTVGTNPSVTLPYVPALTPLGLDIIQSMRARFIDASTNGVPARVRTGLLAAHLLLVSTAAAYVSLNFPDATTPFTWGSGDQIILGGRYQMTTRYT